MEETIERVQSLKGQLERINLAIRAKEEIARRVWELTDRCESQSDLGWFLSMLAGDAGTILAVFNGLRRCLTAHHAHRQSYFQN